MLINEYKIYQASSSRHKNMRTEKNLRGRGRKCDRDAAENEKKSFQNVKRVMKLEVRGSIRVKWLFAVKQ